MVTMDLGAPLAQGREAEIYPYGAGKVLKLFFAHASAEQVEREARYTHMAHATGLPVPAVYEQVQMNNRHGVVMERIDGKSLLQLLKAQPWKAAWAGRLLGELHAAMHNQRGEGFTAQRAALEWCIGQTPALSATEKAAIIAWLHCLPEGDRLCHSDFHIDNIILTARGPVMIDWAHPTCGNPLGDAARSVLMLTVGDPPDATAPVTWLARRLRGTARKHYLQTYCALQGVQPEAIYQWMLPVAAARLRENIPGETPLLLGIIRRGLEINE